MSPRLAILAAFLFGTPTGTVAEEITPYTIPVAFAYYADWGPP